MLRNLIAIISCALCMVLNDSVQRLSWLYFSFLWRSSVRGYFGQGNSFRFCFSQPMRARLLIRALLANQGRGFGKIFSPGVGVTVRMES